jgi:hypothetical protein
MTVIQGFDEALIGTGLRTTGREVLVYDAYIAQDILNEWFPNEGVLLVEFLRSIEVDSLGDNAPIFVFRDDEILGEIRAARKAASGSGRVHWPS